MMYNQAKEELRGMRARADEIFKGAKARCISVTLLHTVATLGLSFLALLIKNTVLYAVMLLILAFIAATLQLGLCEYFLALCRGEKPSAKLLARYFDNESLPMVAMMALISWSAGMLGMFTGLALVAQLVVSAMTFLVPYLFVTRGGRPLALLRAGIAGMRGRWELYFRILVRQYLYTLAASLAMVIVLNILLAVCAAAGVAAFFVTQAGNIVIMAISVLLAVAVSTVVTAYFQVYFAQFAGAQLERMARAEMKSADDEQDFVR